MTRTFHRTTRAVLSMFAAVLCISAGPTTRPAVPPRHSVQGVVEDAAGHRIRTLVFSFDADTGVPYSNVTDRWPLTDGTDNLNGKDICVPTGVDGRFTFHGLFPGPYRFFAQSWDGESNDKGLLDLKSDSTTLYGIAEDVNVTADGKPPYLAIKPAGTAAIHLTFEAPDTFVLVSTRPLGGDAILQTLSWKGDFLRHLIGATHMRHKQATMHGLPAGPIYVYALQNGDGGPQAFGDATAVAKPGETVEIPIELVSPIKGERKMPDEMARQQTAAGHDPRFQAAVRAALPPRGKTDARQDWADVPLDREIAVVDGRPVTVRDYCTWDAYRSFNAEAREWAKSHGGADK